MFSISLIEGERVDVVVETSDDAARRGTGGRSDGEEKEKQETKVRALETLKSRFELKGAAHDNRRCRAVRAGSFRAGAAHEDASRVLVHFSLFAWPLVDHEW